MLRIIIDRSRHGGLTATIETLSPPPELELQRQTLPFAADVAVSEVFAALGERVAGILYEREHGASGRAAPVLVGYTTAGAPIYGVHRGQVTSNA